MAARVVACRARAATPSAPASARARPSSSVPAATSAPANVRRRDALRVALLGALMGAADARAADLASYLLDKSDRSVDLVDAMRLDDLPAGWETLESGVAFIMDKASEGNAERGILDTVDHYIPNPFVTVSFTAYFLSDGHAFASSAAARRPYNYQAGVKDEVQDEAIGGVMGMKVGERRRFIVPPELCYKRKCFGQYLPRADDGVLVDVELLSLQPY